jgi:hypothetical protein
MPGSIAADAVTWAYVLGLTAWYWRLLQGLFLLRSFSGGATTGSGFQKIYILAEVIRPIMAYL